MNSAAEGYTEHKEIRDALRLMSAVMRGCKVKEVQRVGVVVRLETMLVAFLSSHSRYESSGAGRSLWLGTSEVLRKATTGCEGVKRCRHKNRGLTNKRKRYSLML